MTDAAEAIETVLVPVTGQIRMTLPSSKERAKFIAELEEESAKVKRGQYTLFEKGSFISWMMEGYNSHKKSK